MTTTVVSFGAASHPAAYYPTVVYFTEELPGVGGCSLAAAVVWRVPTAPRRWSWRDPIRRIRSYFGPLGIHLHRKGRLEPWTGSSGERGEQETLFNPERRVVRALGREYALPEPGRTVVLLIEERPGAGMRPSVVQRILELPPIERPRGGADGSLTETSRWAELLQRDPEVAAFMAVE